MSLKNWNELNFLELIDNNYIYLMVIILILFFGVAITLKSDRNIKHNFGYKVIFFAFSGVFFFLNLLLFSTAYANEGNNGMCKYTEQKTIPSLVSNGISKVDNKDKIIIVGDSRMDYIISDKDKFNIPVNYTFIAKSGGDIGWFKLSALPKLYEVLDNIDSKYNYHVIINLGVNDIQYYEIYEPKIVEYIDIYHNLINKYQSVNFYLLSINPIHDNKLNKSQPNNIRTTEKIEYMNYQLENDVKKMKKYNYHFCNSYDDISFHTLDGLHYTVETGQDVIDYITRKCIKNKTTSN